MEHHRHDTPVFLATAQPGRKQRQLALAVFGVSLAFFLAFVPFAKLQLPPVAAFIPVYQSALVVSDLITAVLLFGQFRILRSRGLAFLATGYLFTAFIAVAHALTFPGLFAPGGLFGAGAQSTAWLYMFWHAVFPLFVIAYARSGRREVARTGACIAACIAGAFALAGGALLIATSGQSLLPAIMAGNRYTPSMIVVVSATWAFSVLAMFFMWRRRTRTVIDLWLTVVMSAWLFDIALSAMLNHGRYDLGFYAGRIYGLLAATFVMITLLLENGMLYERLADSSARERERAAELERLGGNLEQANHMLAAKNRQLQEASRLKSDFLANMSHELRTPLNAIIGFSEVLKDGLVGKLEAQQKEYIADIHGAGKHLLALINDILDLSKVEAGKMTLELEPVPVEMLVHECLHVMRERASAQRLELTADIEDDLDDVLLDARKTRQILYNLLSNAVKFTPEGGTVRVSARKVGGERFPQGRFAHYLELSVTDSGIGISPQDQARLFQPFTQIDSRLSRRHEGTGLGLALLKHFAELHGGDVSLRSAPGEGSTFTVLLPWRQGDEPAAAVPDAVASGSTSAHSDAPLALVIEDDEKSASLLRLQLEGGGFRTIRTGTAEVGLETAARERPDVIILDLLLPGMNGWEALERLKRDPELCAIPVVIVSILADGNHGLSLGAARVLQKPVGRAELLEALEAIGFGTAGGNAKRTVLVVDDDRKAVELARAHLHAAGYQAFPAYGGRQAIALAKHRRPDLIVLDLMMPEVNGFDVVEALKDDPATRAIPVVILTAKHLADVDRLRLNGHVQEIIQKMEFNHGRFIGEVRRALPGKGC